MPILSLVAVMLMVPAAVAGDEKIDAQTRKQGKAVQVAAHLEAQVLRALSEANAKAVDALADDVAWLKAADRQTLPFRLRPGAVEFRFQGECPGHTGYVEFIVSNKNRDYESLLVLDKTELQRFERLWKVVEQLAGAKQLKNVKHRKGHGMTIREPALELSLMYAVKGEPRIESLDSIFLKSGWGAKAELAEDDGLWIEDDRHLDKTLVPSTRQPGQIIVVVRPAFLNK